MQASPTATMPIDADLVILEEVLIAHLRGEAEAVGTAVPNDVDIVNVVDAHLAYSDAMGAVGLTSV